MFSGKTEISVYRLVVEYNKKCVCLNLIKIRWQTVAIKARISRSIDGKENVEMVLTCSKDGVGKKTKISAGGKTRRRKRKR
jgi:hypothetical protein